MASISAETASHQLLAYCIAGERWPDRLLQAALLEDEGRAFLRIVVERLGDLFEPRLCDVYARLFSQVIERVRPDLEASQLLARYERIRQPRVCPMEASEVFVLSRITLGADVAITSVLLDAAKRRFPEARIVFVGPAKNAELFDADDRIEVLPLAYPRNGSLFERIAAFRNFDTQDSIVIDTDSRISQLGLLPICEESRHFFFESRAYGGDSNESLTRLAQRWAKETFEVDANCYLALASCEGEAEIAVSFGVGDNAEKRIEGSFERELLRLLCNKGRVVVDKGLGAEEKLRVEAMTGALQQVSTYEGAYAGFAARIAGAKLYVGYDSAGQHVASTAGTPVLAIFAGYPSDRFVDRWRPKGVVVKVRERSLALDQVRSALQNLTL